MEHEETFFDKLEEYQARQAAKEEAVDQFEDSKVTEDTLSLAASSSPALQELRSAWESISMKEIFLRNGGRIVSSYANQTHGWIKVYCAFHDDGSNSSAQINMDENLYKCWTPSCPVGGEGQGGLNKAGLAAKFYGIPNRAEDFHQIKKRVALEYRGYDYDKVLTETPSEIDEDSTDAEVSAVEEQFEYRVRRKKYDQLVYLEAREQALHERAAGVFEPPEIADHFQIELNTPDPEIEWSIEGLHQVGGNTTIAAGYKVGKTTFMINLIRSFVDKMPFLGVHQVRELEGRVAFWNFEVEQTQMVRNIREVGLKHPENLTHFPFRGIHMDIMTDVAYEWALAQLRRLEIEIWILDPFSGAYYGDENSNSELNAFCKRLDQLKRAAGIVDLFIPVHTGRMNEEGKERARGATKLDDWVDTRWILARNDMGMRYFKADGRRVEHSERELNFDTETKHVEYSEYLGTRSQKQGDVTKEVVRAYIKTWPGRGANEIARGVGMKKTDVLAAINDLKDDIAIETRRGSGNRILHYIIGEAPPL